MIRISIVTVTYNAARSLYRTVQSVAVQTYPIIEHLILDGASTDETLQTALTYKAESPHTVVVQSEPDSGLYDAMNKALDLVTGDYVVFLNAGDALPSPDTIATVAACAQCCPSPTLAPAVIYGDTDIVDAEGRFLRHRRLCPPKHLTWRSFRQGMLVCHQAFYARTDLARLTRYDLRYRHSADVDWCIRIMQEAERRRLPLYNAGAVLADFEDGGNTTRHHRASLRERFRVMCHHYGLLTTLLMHGWFVVRAIIKH